MKTRPGVALLPAVLAGIIAGCASAPPSGRGEQPPDAAAPQPVNRAAINLSGFPLAYREGYSAGCGNARRDEARFKADVNYQMGWNDGHGICAGRK